MERRARLVLVDDHDLVRAGMRKLLAGDPDLEVVGEASDGREALALCRRLSPDLVLMDVRMPQMDGLSTTRMIKRDHPDITVVMVTMYDDPNYMLDAIKAGAAGYVLKDSSQDELTAAVRRALDGESPLDVNLATKLLLRLARETEERRPNHANGKNGAASLPGSLTKREAEVLRLLARGKTNRKIAEELTLSAGTVKIHVQHIIGKLGVSDRTQAAVRAVESGLLAQD
jgi:DNA-binding NarL/FixJ family response regulator